jgi:hypothetical protein
MTNLVSEGLQPRQKHSLPPDSLERLRAGAYDALNITPNRGCVLHFQEAKEVPTMPLTKEFIVLMEDRPSTLGKVCQALADREVNILALQSFPIGGKSVTRFIVDNPTTAKTVLDSEQLTYVEAEIVQAKLPHRPGEIARVASLLGEANININYAYCGLEPGTDRPLVFFGVTDISKAAPILEQAAAAAAKP